MPLVVPGLQNNDGDQLSEWATKLMGKKIGDKHDETVSLFTLIRSSWMGSLGPWRKRIKVDGMKREVADLIQTFAKTDLPQKHRVIGPNQGMTMDFVPER